MTINQKIENAIELEDWIKESLSSDWHCNGNCEDCVLQRIGECEDSEDILTSEDYREYLQNGLW